MPDRRVTDPEYLTISEAAEYLGVSTQTLRRWDASGKLRPVRHPASEYRYYRRTDLEPFRLAYRRAMQEASAGHLFQTAQARVADNDLLREPQRDAHAKVRAYFATQRTPAIVQIPVGCGKTGLIAILPFGIAAGRVLIIAPNVTIRGVVARALDIANPDCFWRKTKVLPSVAEGPFCAILDGPDANIHDCTESHFVVTNIQQLASSADRWLPQFPPGFFDMILVDEGHHNVAESWRKVFERFSDAKVVSLTATPFRSDGQRPTGEIVYRYPFTKAMLQGYIKQIRSISCAPAEIYFTYKGDERRHTLEEVLELREEAWFRRGVALAPECNRHIAEASIVRCLHLRNRSTIKHQIIAVACSIDHARQVRAIYEERGLEAREIYSEMEDDKKERVLEELRQGRIDCIVQVQMLGEGFDHPPLSVAAIFRPFRSLSAYVQFVGRIMRVNQEGDPAHPDNFGYIVSHVGLNNDAHWQDFREFDLEDQALLKLWLEGKALGEDLSEEGGQPRRFDAGMQVQDEIISHFIGSLFLDPDDDRVLDLIFKQKIPGTPFTVGDLKSREELREMLRAKRREHEHRSEAIPVSPQRRRRAAKQRLAERTNSVVARVLRDLNLSLVGREVGHAVPKVGGSDNRTAVTRLLNLAINDSIGISKKSRNTMTAAQAEQALQSLDRLGDEVRERIRREMEGSRGQDA
jgi:excisionase family DNA binding protein